MSLVSVYVWVGDERTEWRLCISPGRLRSVLSEVEKKVCQKSIEGRER